MLNEQGLISQGKSILEENWKGGFTIPTNKLYPFQWFWDSGFVSVGWAHFNIDYAIQEIRSLLSGQWENGMIPHIIFHSEEEKTYFPNWDFWDSAVNKGAPERPKTSGITQPPVLGFILEFLLDAHREEEKIVAFAKECFPKIKACHRFFYQKRDPNHEGLFFIYHPWESGRDNSPLWDDALSLIDMDSINIPSYKRRDLTIAEANVRPTSVQYDQYVYLLQLGKKHRYDGQEIAKESEFLIQDSMMNAILIKSNESLIKIGKELGFDTKEIEEWQQQSIRSYENKLWNKVIGMYSGYDLRQNKQFPHREIGGLVPLFSGSASQSRADLLNDYLKNLHENNFLLCPSFDVESELYESKRYWRGPIWPQMNWMIHHGCKKYGFLETAEIVKNDLLELVQNHGFYEYFDAQKHLMDHQKCGYGGNNFSWTASSVIDLIS